MMSHPSRWRLIRYRNSVYRRIDRQGFKSLKRKYRYDEKKKYLRLEHEIWKHLHHAAMLNLDGAQPKRILDVGCGGGMFSVVCEILGHRVTGIDAPSDMYADMARVFKVERVVHTIRAFKSIPELNGPFDLITAFATKFDHRTGEDHSRRKNGRGLWSAAEWRFFLVDLARQMKSEGMFFFKLNKHSGGIEKGRILSKDAEHYFQAIGAKRRLNTICITKKQIEKMENI